MFFHLWDSSVGIAEWSKAQRFVSTGVDTIPQLSKSIMYNFLAIFEIFGGVFCTPLMLRLGRFWDMLENSIGFITVPKISLGHDFFGCILLVSVW